MNANEMKWSEFRDILLQHPDRDLQFLYDGGKTVSPSYHITEIKQAPITSVDCGGVMNAWTEVIMQLMEPAVNTQQRPMKVRKALSIVEIVEKKLALNPSAIIKIEFGNASFDTRQLHPGEIVVSEEELTVQLTPGKVQCKAVERGGSCGAPAEKQKVELKNLTTAACCTPGGGCC
jgi:hypothetical protein